MNTEQAVTVAVTVTVADFVAVTSSVAVASLASQTISSPVPVTEHHSNAVRNWSVSSIARMVVMIVFGHIRPPQNDIFLCVWRWMLAISLLTA